MDKRTKRQKLEDMASQSVSPNEAEIARKKLENMKEEEPIFARHIEFSMEFKMTDEAVERFWHDIMASGFGEY